MGIDVLHAKSSNKVSVLVCAVGKRFAVKCLWFSDSHKLSSVSVDLLQEVSTCGPQALLEI